MTLIGTVAILMELFAIELIISGVTLLQSLLLFKGILEKVLSINVIFWYKSTLSLKIVYFKYFDYDQVSCIWICKREMNPMTVYVECLYSLYSDTGEALVIRTAALLSLLIGSVLC